MRNLGRRVPTVEITAFSHRGARRVRNQDRALVAGWLVPDGVLLRRRLLLGHPVFIAVADGAGGHPFGERASADALASMASGAVTSTTAALAESIVSAHHALHDQMTIEPESSGMATTIAALVVTPQDTLYANVGDSAVFDLGSDELFQLSIDDHPPRPPGVDPEARSSVVTQVVGGADRAVLPQPHVGRCPTEPGLRLLVCSDGLEAALSRAQIAQIVRDAGADVQAVRILVDEALRAGAPDNVTVVMVHLEGAAGE